MQQRPGAQLLAFPPQAPRQAHAPYAQHLMYTKAPYGQQQQAPLPYSQKCVDCKGASICEASFSEGQ